MQYKVYVDGREGTTGLRIIERLENRSDIELLLIDEKLRKDTAERKRLINKADYVFLCLPDDAAREAVSLIENDHVKVIDASTAHRTNDDWAYGFPELDGSFFEKIKCGRRVAVPGCYASGFLALCYPLVAKGIIPSDYPITAFAVSGYSGAGKKAIAEYEGSDKPQSYNSPRLYALGQEHKHLPEMEKIAGLTYPPMFNPIIDDYYSGMLVNIPLQTRTLDGVSVDKLKELYRAHYQNQPMIRLADENGFLAANTVAHKDYLEIIVNGNSERILLTARLDNLGKGASGAAVQCMNIMMGADQTTGLVID